MPQKTKEEKKKYDEIRRNTPEVKKKYTISNWRCGGLVVTSEEEMDEIYDRYLASKKCEKKGCEYTKSNWKCMDHKHLIGKFGYFRNIVCRDCNCNDNSRNTSGTPNVYKHTTSNGWVYERRINKIRHRKYFETKEDAIAYKISFE